MTSFGRVVSTSSMQSNRILFAFSALVFLAGCNNPAQQTQPNVYYDVAGFVQRQVTLLSQHKPLVNKATQIKGERSRQATRNINWNRELELFSQADINKPALRNSYQISRPDSLTYQYSLKKDEEKLTVRSLRVQLDPTTRQPRRIEAVLRTGNPLYTSERRLLLESGPANGNQWQVQHYQLSGFQQLSYFDKNEFRVEGVVQ